jgi:two-component system, cell cycle sensor histidine kinase and response regulator CckA
MIQNATRRGAEIVSNVRQYLTGNQVVSDSVDLNTLLEESIELTRPMWQAKRNVSIVRQFEPIPRVRANAAEMRRIFANLIINALEAMPNGGTLIVGGERANGKVRAFVEDTGEGIAPERQSKIFEPYYTTKKQGTGLGLSSALKILRSQQGDLTFTTNPGQGTRFVVEMPANPPESRAA